MTTLPDDVRSRPTLAQQPQQWAGPSFLWSSPREEGWQLTVGGWRWRSIAWEHRYQDAGLTDHGPAHTPWGWTGHQLTAATTTPPAPAAGEAVAELEVILDAPRDGSDPTAAATGLRDALRATLGADAAAELDALPTPGSTSVTRNRPLLPDSGTGLQVADVRFSSLPYGHGDPQRPVQFASRWLRLAATRSALVALWGPLEGQWQPQYVRWPHHAVPSRQVDSLRTAAGPADLDTRLAALLTDCLRHEQYYLETWQMELETWEATIYQSLATGEAVLKGIDLSDPVRAQAGNLAVFLSRTQLDLRATQRRAEVEPLFNRPPVQAVLQPALAAAVQTQAVNQRLRREAFALLTSVAAGEQLQAARDLAGAAHAQQRATEGVQHTITWVTALLLAPTVVIGVFGANLQEFAAGKGTLAQLALWMVLAAGLSMCVLWWRNPPAARRGPLGLAPAVLLLTTIAGTAVLLADHRSRIALLWAGAAGAWTAATSIAQLRSVRASDPRVRPWSRLRRGETAAWT